jgi:hypothetical protein
MQTLAAINTHLNKDLAKLTASYICPPNASPEDAAFHGHYELVAATHDDDVTQRMFQRACKGGHMPVILQLLGRGDSNRDAGFYAACRGGHLDVMEVMRPRDPHDWSSGFDDACCGGHLDVIDATVDRNATRIYCNHAGCKMGTLPVVRHLIEVIKVHPTCMHSLIRAACKCGDIDSVEYLFKRAEEPPWPSDLADYMGDACDGGHMPVITMLTKLGVSDWLPALNGACYGGHLSIVQHVLERVGINYDMRDTLRVACGSKADTTVVQYLLDRGGDATTSDMMQAACCTGNIAMVNLLIARGNTSWNAGMEAASAGGRQTLVKLMATHGANNWDECLLAAADGVLRIVQFMLDMGATATDAALDVAKDRRNGQVVRYLRDIRPIESG